MNSRALQYQIVDTTPPSKLCYCMVPTWRYSLRQEILELYWILLRDGVVQSWLVVKLTNELTVKIITLM